MDKDNSEWGCVASLCSMGIAMSGWIWFGYVLAVLWGWFAVPTWQIAPITTAQGMAIILAVRLVTFTANYSKKIPDITPEYLGRQFSYTALGPALALFYGWVLRGLA